MQQALRQMNVQLANLISDRSGLTRQAIMRAITAGERDAIISPARIHFAAAILGICRARLVSFKHGNELTIWY
jgi:acyl-CoA synthetase (AMP-forming)/AMP-acid ligase II